MFPGYARYHLVIPAMIDPRGIITRPRRPIKILHLRRRGVDGINKAITAAVAASVPGSNDR